MRSVAVIVLALVATASAQPHGTQLYRVKQKDTLDVIAAEFYGDRQHANLIVAENKLKDRRVVPGQRLRVPVTREITTAKSDTFESLAHTYLGDAKRAQFLADFNNLLVSEVPATGTVLTIPLQVTHVAQNPESLASIAAQLLGDSKQAELLRTYNGLEKNGLDKGESIVVPVRQIRVRKLPAVDADSKARREQQRQAYTDAATALPTARAAWLQGDFTTVKSTLTELATRADFLDQKSAVEVGLLLGKAHVAFKDSTAAVAAFTQVIDRKPTHMLTTYAESPKVIDAWKKAGGQVQE